MRHFLYNSAGPVLIGAALGIVSILVWRVLFHSSDLDQGIAALQKATFADRQFSGRLSMLGYAPISKSSETAISDSEDFQRGKELLFRSLDESNPLSDEAVGLVYLLKRDYKTAISSFRLAIERKPYEEHFHNDLGAAIMEKAQFDKNLVVLGREPKDMSTQEFEESLGEFRTALDLNSSLPEASFNLAN
ncbi:MAG TPA: hypothetical protein VEZ90_09055 [Blastocatellia bacterium]|nr:hypothetical protein [Blastocatellia bacterium]